MIKALLVILVISAYVNLAAPPANCDGDFDKWCLACTGTNCTTCAKGYISSNKCAPLTNLIPFCLSGASATTCQACLPGYYLNSNSTQCVVAIPKANCYAYIRDGAGSLCISCVDGKVPGTTSNNNFINCVSSCEDPSSGSMLVQNCFSVMPTNA
jgi:hypothetical protein